MSSEVRIWQRSIDIILTNIRSYFVKRKKNLTRMLVIKRAEVVGASPHNHQAVAISFSASSPTTSPIRRIYWILVSSRDSHLQS